MTHGANVLAPHLASPACAARSGAASGYKHSATAASARLTWAANGALHLYVYPMEGAQQDPSYTSVCKLGQGYGDSMFPGTFKVGWGPASGGGGWAGVGPGKMGGWARCPLFHVSAAGAMEALLAGPPPPAPPSCHMAEPGSAPG